MAMKEAASNSSVDQWAVFPDTTTDTEDVWTQFTSTETTQCSVFERCFPALEAPLLQASTVGSLSVRQSDWSQLQSQALLPDSTLPLLSARPPDSRPPPLELLVDCDTFDWSTEDKVEVLPSIFKPAKPESPIDIQFDHSRAALGLASLTLEELRAMNEEMRLKFNRLSRVLVEGLEERDALVSELDVKNRFVAAILRVQSLRVSNMEEGRGRKRTWSLKQSDERSNRKYLDTVLPYHQPEGLSWSCELLTTLTTILQAIAEHSERVPTLVSDYIQEHILESLTEKWTEHTLK